MLYPEQQQTRKQEIAMEKAERASTFLFAMWYTVMLAMLLLLAFSFSALNMELAVGNI